jgi:hypothetical protein
MSRSLSQSHKDCSSNVQCTLYSIVQIGGEDRLYFLCAPVRLSTREEEKNHGKNDTEQEEKGHDQRR